MAQTTKEREHGSSQEDGDMVEIWVNIHKTDITVPIMVKSGATVSDVLEAIQAYYTSLGGTFNPNGSQVMLNDNQYVIDREGNIKGDLAYTIHAAATFTLTRNVTGGLGR